MHVEHMAKMIQIRHVPDSLHRRLRARAAIAGMSLSDYLRLELTRVAEQLTPEELRARLAAMSSTAVKERPTDAVRAERDRK
jgi:plasmid stability protein